MGPAFLLSIATQRLRQCLGSSLGNLIEAALLDTGSFAGQATQVEQTGTTYFTATHHLDFIDVRRQQGKNTLGADLVNSTGCALLPLEILRTVKVEAFRPGDPAGNC